VYLGQLEGIKAAMSAKVKVAVRVRPMNKRGEWYGFLFGWGY